MHSQIELSEGGICTYVILEFCKEYYLSYYLFIPASFHRNFCVFWILCFPFCCLRFGHLSVHSLNWLWNSLLYPPSWIIVVTFYLFDLLIFWVISYILALKYGLALFCVSPCSALGSHVLPKKNSIFFFIKALSF